MNVETHAKYEARARIIKAVAHPSRLFIVAALAEKPHCVCELTDMIGSDMSTVSKHLSVLKNAGIVEDTKHGTMVYYALKTRCVLDFITCAESVMKHKLEGQMKLLSTIA